MSSNEVKARSDGIGSDIKYDCILLRMLAGRIHTMAHKAHDIHWDQERAEALACKLYSKVGMQCREIDRLAQEIDTSCNLLLEEGFGQEHTDEVLSWKPEDYKE